jgi:hypothetical protein
LLPPFIIEQIRKREEELQQRYEQPQLEIPRVVPPPRRNKEEPEEAERGVIIVEL